VVDHRMVIYGDCTEVTCPRRTARRRARAT
jgi:hypothetical protein